MSDADKNLEQMLDRKLGVFVEHIDSRIDTVFEIVSDIQHQVSVLPTMQEDISILKEDVKVIKLAVKETNEDLQLIDQRVTKLEAAA